MNEAISDVAAQMTSALSDVQAAHKALEDARAKLAPLEAAAEEADNKLEILIGQFQGLRQPSGGTTTRRKRGGIRVAAKPRTAEQNVTIQMKKAYTTAIKGGSTEKDAKKAAEVAGKNAAKKANYTAPLPQPSYK